MNAVIIEDEVQTALDLKTSIETLQPESKVLAILDSVESGIEWFRSNNKCPDIIFSDIQLGDGLAFDILSSIDLKCPVVFCTAYDEYAMQAFRNNGIDYLLKPITDHALEESLIKFNNFKQPVENTFDKSALTELMKQIAENCKSYKSTFLVAYREKMLPVNVEEIMFFCISDTGVKLRLKNNQQYNLNLTLDHIESVVNPATFFRANRQYLVAYQAIKEAEHYYERKLLIQLTIPNSDPIIVSKAKATEFLRWLENH